MLKMPYNANHPVRSYRPKLQCDVCIRHAVSSVLQGLKAQLTDATTELKVVKESPVGANTEYVQHSMSSVLPHTKPLSNMTQHSYINCLRWWPGLVVARWSRSTKLPYAGPG